MLGLKKKPVTIVTGYLGSGKTTFLNELIKNEGAKGLALIVNDMGSVNIDASLLKRSNVLQADAKMVELSNGCICCTLQDAFMSQIEQLSKDKSVERILVEASGISNPASIADGFLTYQEDFKKNTFFLDSIVTVVDADRIYTEFLDDMVREESDDENPDIINLVMDQIEFCNTILLNKCDLRTPEELLKIKDVIRGFQREATIIECIRGKVNPDRIFSGEKFDYEKVMNSSAMQQALAREARAEEVCTDEYGISSFVFEETKPFDHDKFMDFINNEYPEGITRAKGYIWFADDDVHVQLFEQAGRNATVSEVSNWVASLPEEDKKLVFEEYPDVLDAWDDTYGDRLNQLVFIGRNYNKESMISKLKSCIA